MNYIERSYPWLLLSPVLLPLVMWSGLIYPYLVPKILLFYAISFISFGAFVLLVTYGRAFYWGRLSRWEAWIPGALLLLAYISSYYGLDFYRSFWSLFIRGDGLLMITCAVGSFYLILLYADRMFFERLLRAVAAVASFVAVYGIGEWLVNGGRTGSLLGNAAFFAGYLGIAFFATLVAAHTLSQGWRRTAYIGAVLQVIAIVLTATRGTMIALIVVSIVTLTYIAFQKRRPLPPEAKNGTPRAAWRRFAVPEGVPSPTPFFASGGSGLAQISFAALIVIVGIFFAFRGELAKVPFEPISRIASISVSDGTVSSRLFIWKNMVTEIQKGPWLGVGVEHIDTLFNRFYDPTQIYEQWFDRSHNAFLDYAAQYGIGGLLLYVALIAAFFTSALRLWWRKEQYLAGIFALLAGTYALQNFFVFDTVSSFWLLLALLAVLIAISLTDVSLEVLPLASWTRGASWIFAAILVFLIIPVSVRPALAAYDLAHAYTYQFTDVPKEVGYLSHGFALGTYGDIEYGYIAYDMYVNNQVAVLTGNARTDAYQSALNILSANFDRYAYDGRTALYLAHVLSLAPEGVSIDHNLLSSALTRAIEKSPKRSQSWYVLANISISNANLHPPGSKEHAAGYATAQDILTKYIALVPTLSAPRFVLAELLYVSGNVQGAQVEAEKGRAVYIPDVETSRRAVGYYERVSDWQSARFFLSEILTFEPQDHNVRYDLAKVTYLAGDPAVAAAIVAELRQIDPALLETDQNFLNAITAYESR